MQSRRGFLVKLAAGFAAMAVLVGVVVADELLGTITKVDAENKTITVEEKGSDKEIDVKITDETEYVTKKGSRKVNLEKLEKRVDRIKEKGRKGISVKITHDKGVASKIEFSRGKRRKKAAD